jgi:CHRD domain
MIGNFMKKYSNNTIRTCLFGAVASMLLGLSACSKSPTAPATPSSSSLPSNSSSPAAVLVGTDVTATLGGSSEVPAVSGGGMGTFEARLDPATSLLKWTVTYSGLTGPATAAHFHGPAVAGENAPPVVPVDGNLASPIVGVTTLTAAQMSDLKAGKWYFNIHTAANSNGEIRGQLAVKP